MTEVCNLEMFDRIDQLVKAHKIIDLEEALDLEQCNIIEVYYSAAPSTRTRELSRKALTFQTLNGVLLYHKNRLITRHRYPLGEIHKLFRGRLKQVPQGLAMFGFIEVKEEFPPNIFKNVLLL